MRTLVGPKPPKLVSSDILFIQFFRFQHHVVGAQLCRLSPVDAHTVALNWFTGKY